TSIHASYPEDTPLCGAYVLPVIVTGYRCHVLSFPSLGGTMSNTPATPTAICFDLDDTLIDDTGASSAGLHALMERLGHPDFGAARSLWDVQTEISFSAYLRGRLSLEQQRRERVRALAVQTGHADITDQHCDELYQQYLAAHRASWQLFPDTVPTLRALGSAGYRLA